jgi:hypothetical protein
MGAHDEILGALPYLSQRLFVATALAHEPGMFANVLKRSRALPKMHGRLETEESPL